MQFKKNIFFILLSTTICFFNSCQTDIDSSIHFSTSKNNDREKVLNEARAWYENYRPSGISRLKSFEKDSFAKVTPNWKQAFRRQNKDFKVVEAALIWSVKSNFAIEECYQAYKETGDRRYHLSKTRIVIVTDRKSNETVAFLMTLMPDRECLESNNFQPFQNVTYLDKKKFGGRIVFFDLDGKFIEGLLYENGEEVGTMFMGDMPISAQSIKRTAKPKPKPPCQTQYCDPCPIYEMREYCQFMFDAEYNSFLYCENYQEIVGMGQCCQTVEIPCD